MGRDSRATNRSSSGSENAEGRVPAGQVCGRMGRPGASFPTYLSCSLTSSLCSVVPRPSFPCHTLSLIFPSGPGSGYSSWVRGLHLSKPLLTHLPPRAHRGGGLHQPGGPGDAEPHRESAQAPFCHWLPGVRAQHHPGLHQAGGPFPGAGWR